MQAITSSTADVALASIPAGQTLLRIHADVRFMVAISAAGSHAQMEATHAVAGFYTTLTTGGTILNAGAQQSDFAPPLQRWLWWEQLTPIAIPLTNDTSAIYRTEWRIVPAQSPIDIESQVKATSPITLHLALYTSNNPITVRTFDAWYWASVLRSS